MGHQKTLGHAIYSFGVSELQQAKKALLKHDEMSVMIHNLLKVAFQ